MKTESGKAKIELLLTDCFVYVLYTGRRMDPTSSLSCSTPVCVLVCDRLVERPSTFLQDIIFLLHTSVLNAL